MSDVKTNTEQTRKNNQVNALIMDTIVTCRLSLIVNVVTINAAYCIFLVALTPLAQFAKIVAVFITQHYTDGLLTLTYHICLLIARSYRSPSISYHNVLLT